MLGTRHLEEHVQPAAERIEMGVCRLVFLLFLALLREIWRPSRLLILGIIVLLAPVGGGPADAHADAPVLRRGIGPPSLRGNSGRQAEFARSQIGRLVRLGTIIFLGMVNVGASTTRKVCAAVGCAALIGGCALIATQATSPQPAPKAAQLLAAGNYVEAHLMRRFAEGHLLVRLPDGTVWLLDPKKHCSWCWIYVGKRVWVELGQRSATLLNPKGELAECWNGGPMSKY